MTFLDQRCGKNEEYSDCGSACPDSCQRRNRHCIQRCESGCFCKKGYIRDDATGNCVREEECQTHGKYLETITNSFWKLKKFYKIRIF